MAKKPRSTAKKTDRDQDLALPDRRALEALMRQFVTPPGGKRRKKSDLDRAQNLMDQAFDASGVDQVRLALQALATSPDCADAYVLLAEHAATAEEAGSLYEQGVAAGERALGKRTFAECEGHFWGMMETRPYMRARQGLAQYLWDVGRLEEAATHFQEMLRLNPGDNQGVRYSLATLLLDMERDDDVRRLLSHYEDDAMTDLSYTKVILALRARETAQAEKLLKQAVKANKHVPAYLLGNKQLPLDMPPYVTMGGDDEAAAYAFSNGRVWLNTPGAISWLRQTLKAPLPKPPKPRRPSWPQLRMALLRCPRELDEVWQVDALPASDVEQGEPTNESPWVIMVVSRTSQVLLGLQCFDSKPKPAEMWDYLTNVIRKPLQTDSHRPATIEVCQKAFQTAWRAKLKQIGVECAVCDFLDSIDQMRDLLPSAMDQTEPEELDVTASQEKILSLPLEPGEIWQADVRPVPCWNPNVEGPSRPWIAVVVNRMNDLVLAHQIAPDRPPAEWLCQTIFQAIQRPTIDEPHRPGAIEVGSVEQRDALLPLFDQIGIECTAVERLDQIDSAFDSMAQFMGNQEGGPPSLLNAPGITPPQIGSFYEAAADFYRRMPWRHVLGDTIIKVEYDKVKSGPWYAIVMGQSGMQQGLAIYEDLAFLQTSMAGERSDEDSARSMSALSMMFSEAFEMPARDLNAAEQHGWTVAGPEAYPMILHVNPGMAMRPPLVWELELMEGCLRTIPDFITRKPAVSATTVPASVKPSVRLSWLDK